jgi:hypothetical protein
MRFHIQPPNIAIIKLNLAPYSRGVYSGDKLGMYIPSSGAHLSRAFNNPGYTPPLSATQWYLGAYHCMVIIILI